MTNAPSKSVIAAFDFDGTLTDGDTSLPFVSFALGKVALWRAVAAVAPLFFVDFLRAVWRERQRHRKEKLGSVRGSWVTLMHERILQRCFSNMSADRLRALGQQFVDHELDKFIRSAGLDRLEWHKRQGHCCVLISASIDVYLYPWGKKVGFDHVMGTELELDDGNVITGRFAVEPCWGGAKVRRLLNQFGPREGYTLYVYGEGAGDRDLIAIADHGFLVRGDFELVEA